MAKVVKVLSELIFIVRVYNKVLLNQGIKVVFFYIAGPQNLRKNCLDIFGVKNTFPR